MQPGFDIEYTIVKAPPRVNAANVADVLARIEHVRARRLILDLGETVSVDSTALGAIVRVHRRQLERGGDVVLARPSEGVRRILIVTRLDGLIPTSPDVETATAPAEAVG